MRQESGECRRETRNAGGKVPYWGSGNYASEEAKEIARLKKRILQIYHASYQNYGAPKITQILRREGEVVSERTVGQYMREMEILTVPTRPGARTLPTSGLKKGFVYLASVMDLFSRHIIAWTLSKTLDFSFVVDAVHLAKARRNVDSLLILHSDRGCQYTSAAYRQAVSRFRLSYSKKRYPYDNACMESFHSLIKCEWLNRVLIRGFRHAYFLVFEYIETFYNIWRIHSHCGFLPPLSFESTSTLSVPFLSSLPF